MVGLTFVPPLAHLGHWYVSLPVFGGPVLVLAIALKIQTWREARAGPDQNGRRSRVTSVPREGGATVAVSGTLDYPTLLELEVELAKVAQRTDEILLDLRGLAAADEEAAVTLCDLLGRYGRRAAVLIDPRPEMDALKAAFASEGIRLMKESSQDRAPCDGAAASLRSEEGS